MTKAERRSLHKKQERLQVQDGVPSSPELKEGVPVIRLSDTGELAEYITFRGILYKKVYTIA